MENKQFQKLVKLAKLRLLRMHYESKVGHIGGNLSSLDIILSIFHYGIKSTEIFVLSKGHSAGALYIALNSIGKLTDKDLESFHQENTLLPGHPPSRGIESVRFATGSLGHGFPLSAGICLGKKRRNDVGRVFCLTSDGEWNEGSTWEALNFTCHHKLNNLTIIVDYNGVQGFGSTDEVMKLSSLSAKLAAFDLEVIEIDGHNHAEIQSAIERNTQKPQIVIAKTIKGKGISFMENKVDWHYWPLTQELYQKAIQEVG